MTYGEILNSDNKEAIAIKEEMNKEIFNSLASLNQGSEYEVSEILIEFDKIWLIKYHFRLSDGYEQDDVYYWPLNESIKWAVNKIKEKIDYIAELRKKYTEYAKQNDHIQKFREFERECKLLDGGCEKTAKLSAELCEYFKLSNAADCCCASGDLEISQTPKRVSGFNENIDRLCVFLENCIEELRNIKLDNGGNKC